MNYRNLISAAALIIFVLISIISGPGCANIIPPQGGPKDSIPPVLIKAAPGDSTRNFTASRITLSFNEFIEIQNIQENLMVSPTPKNNPKVDYKLNSMTVKLKDSLEPNTTYSLNFREAIKDFSEGNILKGFTYVFSTGAYIDSLELRGKVVLAETGKVDSTLIVMLHTSADDSIVVKGKPRYIAVVDGKGSFTFKNLPAKIFYLYALQDGGGTHLYDNNKNLFAFADKPITPKLQPEPITLYAYSAKQPDKPAAATTTNPGNRNKPDAANADKRLRYQTNLISSQLDLLGNLMFTFEPPLRLFDSSKVHFYTDTTFTPVTAYTFEKDSLNKKIQLIHSWKENTLYHLVLEKDFAEDSSGKKLLRTDTLSFKTKKLTDYGSLRLRFKNLDTAKNPVLLFITGNAIYKSVPLGSNMEFSQTLFIPGEYELSILFDDNKNGKWDPGEFFGKHKQPEIVKPIERKITVKPAWQNEFEIAL
jgi:Bacterial Ig-like domain